MVLEAAGPGYPFEIVAVRREETCDIRIPKIARQYGIHVVKTIINHSQNQHKWVVYAIKHGVVHGIDLTTSVLFHGTPKTRGLPGGR